MDQGLEPSTPSHQAPKWVFPSCQFFLSHFHGDKKSDWHKEQVPGVGLLLCLPGFVVGRPLKLVSRKNLEKIQRSRIQKAQYSLSAVYWGMPLRVQKTSIPLSWSCKLNTPCYCFKTPLSYIWHNLHSVLLWFECLTPCWPNLAKDCQLFLTGFSSSVPFLSFWYIPINVVCQPHNPSLSQALYFRMFASQFGTEALLHSDAHPSCLQVQPQLQLLRNLHAPL